MPNGTVTSLRDYSLGDLDETDHFKSKHHSDLASTVQKPNVRGDL